MALPTDDRTTVGLNIWSVFADAVLAMLLLLVFFIFVQFVANSEVFVQILMEEKQAETEAGIRAQLGDDVRYLEVVTDGNLQRLLFSQAILFETASADLKPMGERVLASVGTALRSGEQSYKEIQIEGHTDTVPIKTPRFPSNWELSSARATAVVRFLEDQVGMNPQSYAISAVGKSEYAPIDAGDNARNRRIELVLVYSEEELRPW